MMKFEDRSNVKNVLVSTRGKNIPLPQIRFSVNEMVIAFLARIKFYNNVDIV